MYLISLTAMVVLITCLTANVRDLAKLSRLLGKDTTENLRAMDMPPERYESFLKWGDGEKDLLFEYMAAYLVTGAEKKEQLDRYIDQLKNYKPEEFKRDTAYLSAVWEDLTYFPVPDSSVSQEEVSFVNSWMYERTFGGKRGHEGTDLMAAQNKRGIYPVISMTDGVVEQIGWLTKGGYRIGIRSPHGGYFYYAHLYDYAREFQAGDKIKAGDWIGFMGDSGYSEIEGTVGNFDVHLHVGIYVNQSDGSEMSINPYWPMKFLETKKLTYDFY